MRAVMQCSGAWRVELRAAAIHVTAGLAYYPQLLPHLVQGLFKISRFHIIYSYSLTTLV